MKTPYPYFGGKQKIANVIWSALGDVANYVEPFFGGGGCLLNRPETHKNTVETVNDIDGAICNFWRATKHDPEAVAYYADEPVNEADLMAKHLWLANTGREKLKQLEIDKDWYDPEIAGLWVWGVCSWIGSGFCGGGPWHVEDGKLVKSKRSQSGVYSQRPHLADGGVGVNRQMPLLNSGRGKRCRPHLGDAGRGVNRKRPHLGNAGRGTSRESDLIEYFQRLSNRLRYVRVCNGDWSRVVTTGALSHGTTVGILLDPPYLTSVRSKNLYRCDDGEVANRVRDWCIENGDNPRYRICLCGYEKEHIGKLPDSWTMYSYSANKCYKSKNENRHQERLWLNKNCKLEEK